MPDVGHEFVTALILAGGQSRRFGSDKAAAEVDGEAMIRRVYRAAAPHAGSVLVVVDRADRRYDLPGLGRFVEDAAPDAGPLAGLVAGFRAAETSWVLALACDLPFLTPEALRPLLDAPRDDADALVAVDATGRRQPLCALYRVASVCPVADVHLREGRLALRDLLGALTVRTVALDGDALRNVNAPADLGPGYPEAG